MNHLNYSGITVPMDCKRCGEEFDFMTSDTCPFCGWTWGTEVNAKKVQGAITYRKPKINQIIDKYKKRNNVYNSYNEYDYKVYVKERVYARPVYDRIIIPYRVFEKMFYYTNSVQSEISGLGGVQIDGKEIVIKDVLLFKQECSAGGTTLDAEQLSEFLVGLIKARKKPEDYKLWWHSHYNFETYWSPTDDENIADLSKDSLLASICINQFGDTVGRLDEKGLSANLPITVVPKIRKKTFEKYKKEAKEKVNIAVYKEIQKKRKKRKKKGVKNNGFLKTKHSDRHGKTKREFSKSYRSRRNRGIHSLNANEVGFEKIKSV